ncbi:hypothetical protein LMG31886_04470 [Xanthomonas hydrangeae]|uniref:DUF4304 domain-containing protein n=1 Tax=Xanthomonas hydrangeae TaxID=2775159 RepID=UPI001963808E|nr:hypothetical protein LMG31884_04510 [Xanthomonas hydrangeae]CAD7713130.1 hypothetical protein LMG31884_04510 [Xanthomonas hydrangeae]CAD7718837.1 hypothetical protein LMG31887_04520 [Xanthomonas hydrangeae]CAD7718839.1 hypothetical protein LMG31887_04520 [Xanthomonas hydrangeae]CAD7722840.1 hypothetical protein LMG31886_04470 [Xanthomonas hydrangeae]
MNENLSFEKITGFFDEAMNRIIIDFNFRRAAPGNWSRRQGDEINVINIQKHSSDSLFCVNLGIHYAFLPKVGTGKDVDGDYLEIPDCEIKLRLTDQAVDKDQWWPIATSSIDQVVDLVSRRALPIFDSYRIDGPVAAMSGEDIENCHLGLLASMTKVRACLLLARLQEKLGNRDKCIEAATVGLRVAGMAVGPKKALKGILARV